VNSEISACPARPVGPEDRTGVAPEDGTGACPVAPEDRTGVAPADGTGARDPKGFTKS